MHPSTLLICKTLPLAFQPFFVLPVLIMYSKLDYCPISGNAYDTQS